MVKVVYVIKRVKWLSRSNAQIASVINSAAYQLACWHFSLIYTISSMMTQTSTEIHFPLWSSFAYCRDSEKMQVVKRYHSQGDYCYLFGNVLCHLVVSIKQLIEQGFMGSDFKHLSKLLWKPTKIHLSHLVHNNRERYREKFS